MLSGSSRRRPRWWAEVVPDVLIGGTGPDRFDFNLVSDSTATARDAIRAGGGTTFAFEGAGVAGAT